MAPMQILMDVNPDSKPHYTTKDALDKEKIAPLDSSDGKSSRCINKCKESIKNMEVLLHKQNKAPKSPEDVEVDIIGYTNNNDIGTIKTEDPDATEYSSSFADTTSDAEKCSGLIDAEVESQFIGDASFASAYDAFSSVFHMRKKRLTSHWRSFIRPLMWHCKWTELRIKEIEFQSLKYARELSAYDQRKFSGIDQSRLEGCGSKSLPFSSQCNRKKAIKRRRRKRIEETTDITSYMSCHNLFSYLENKKTIPDGSYIADDLTNTANTGQHTDCSDKFAINNDQLLLEFIDGNNSLEQVLWKIDIVHSRVQKLRSQLDLVISKNASKFSSSENLSLLAACDAQTSSAPSPTFSAGKEETISVGPAYNTTQQISEYDVGDPVMAANALSSYGEAFHVPDIIESNVGLFSFANVSCHQPQIVDSCEGIVENVLIQNEGNAGDRQVLMRTNSQPIKQHHQPEKGEEGESTIPSPIPTSEPNHATKSVMSQEQSTQHHHSEKGEEGESTNPSPTPTSEPNHAAKSIMSQERSTLKSCLASDIYFPKSKRKRGERKAGSGGWIRKQ